MKWENAAAQEAVENVVARVGDVGREAVDIGVKAGVGRKVNVGIGVKAAGVGREVSVEGAREGVGLGIKEFQVGVLTVKDLV
tara:strand:- start:29 stop:274 length:246 start_codon:yes stop_codon:yes gene_type:complete